VPSRDTISKDFWFLPLSQRLDRRYRDDIDPNIANFLKEWRAIQFN
jgi:hypothetical protein